MNRESLKQLMAKHDWSMEVVALIAEVSPHAVRAWLRPVSSKASRCMRPHAASLIAEAADKAAVNSPARRKSKATALLSKPRNQKASGKDQPIA